MSRSISLEETNLLRARLGQSALLDRGDEEVDEAQERAEVNRVQVMARDKEAEADRKAVARKVADHREARLHKASIQGGSIAEQSESTASMSAAEWVAAAKAKGPVETVAPVQKRKVAVISEGADLRIRHDADEFAQGETVILTLKDKRIGSDDEANDNDELENLDFVAGKVIKRNTARKAKRARFDEDGVELPKSVLDKYDEVPDELDARKGGLTLKATGTIIDREAAIRDKLNQALGGTKKQLYDFSASSTKGSLPATDFYTKEEVSKGKTKLVSRKKTKKSKTSRTSMTLQDDIALIESHHGVSADHGSRSGVKSTVKARLEVAEAETRMKRERFEAAMQKSDAKSHTLVDNLSTLFEEDQNDVLLHETMAKAQRVANQKRDHDNASERRTQTAKITSAVVPILDQTVSDQIDDRVAFSAASEFMSNLRMTASMMKEKRVQAIQEAHSKAIAADATLEAPGARPQDAGDDDMEIDSDDEDGPVVVKDESQSESDEDEDDEKLGFMNDVSNLAGGVSGALRLIRSRGMTTERAPILVAGRSHDARLAERPDSAPLLRLDRVDQWGRPMTQKAAFRELSYQFHGHRPGAKKQEKLLKVLDEQRKQQAAKAGQTISGTERLRDSTVRAGRHYVVMDSFGGVVTQKASIDDDADAAPRAKKRNDDEDVRERAYVHGSKKVEFAIHKE